MSVSCAAPTAMNLVMHIIGLQDIHVVGRAFIEAIREKLSLLELAASTFPVNIFGLFMCGVLELTLMCICVPFLKNTKP